MPISRGVMSVACGLAATASPALAGESHPRSIGLDTSAVIIGSVNNAALEGQTVAPDAQTAAAAPADAPLPGDVVVTAQRRTESLQTVPVSVTVASGESLRQQDVRSLEDLSARVPNLRIAAATLSDQIHIRGTGSGYNTGFEQSVATFVDGVYRSRSRASRLALFDIDRVEVLKGPQTTFFGANAIAGALNITTRKPGREFAANATALYAPTDGEYDLEAGVSVPLDENFAVRLAGRWSGMQGYSYSDRYNTKGPHLNDLQSRASAVWTPTDRLTINARLDLARLKEDGTLLLELFDCPPPSSLPTGQCARNLALNPALDGTINHHSGTSEPGGLRLDLEEGEVTGQMDLGAVTLNSITSYQHQRANAFFEIGPYPSPGPIGTPSYLPSYSGENFRQFSQEVRLESDPNRPINFMVGAYYEHQILNDALVIGNFNAPFGALAPGGVYTATTPIGARYVTNQRSDTLSGFGSATAEIVSGLKLTGSLRYTSVYKAATRAVVLGSVPALYPTPDNFVPGPASVQPVLSALLGASVAPFAVPDRRDNKLMPAANLKYQFSRDVMAYVSYARGFKAGGFSGATPDVFAPETVDSYEAGIKAQWFDRRLTTDVTVFRADYQNLQEAQNIITPSGTSLQIVTNAAKSRASGVEFSGALRPDRHLTLHVDAAYLDSHYVSYPNAPCTPLESVGVANCLKDRSGGRRAYAPKWSGSVGADYSTPLSDSAAFRLGATAYFTSDYYQQPAISDLVKQDGYMKVDLRAAISTDNGRYEFAVIGKNITDKLTADYRNYAPAAVGTAYAVADRPRSVAVQVNVKW